MYLKPQGGWEEWECNFPSCSLAIPNHMKIARKSLMVTSGLELWISHASQDCARLSRVGTGHVYAGFLVILMTTHALFCFEKKIGLEIGRVSRSGEWESTDTKSGRLIDSSGSSCTMVYMGRKDPTQTVLATPGHHLACKIWWGHGPKKFITSKSGASGVTELANQNGYLIWAGQVLCKLYIPRYVFWIVKWFKFL